MSKNGLYKRADGIYEKILNINGKRVAFRSKDPKEVWMKIARYEEKEEHGPLFSEIAEQWEEYHFPELASNTLKSYRPALKAAQAEFSSIYLKDIKVNNINAYIRKLVKKDYAHKTVTNYLLVLRLIFEYACENGILEHNPCAYAKVPKNLKKTPRRFPTNEEIEIVKNNTALPFGLFFYFILYSGCRLGEALALQWKDIDFAKKEIHINKSVYYDYTPKIKKPKSKAGTRDIILLDRLIDMLLPIKGKPDDLVFPNPKGELWGNKASWVEMDKYRKETSSKVTPHELRHGFATMLYEAGIDIKTSQYFLGHAQASTTLDIYTTLRDEQKRKAADALNSLI